MTTTEELEKLRAENAELRSQLQDERRGWEKDAKLAESRFDTLTKLMRKHSQLFDQRTEDLAIIREAIAALEQLPCNCRLVVPPCLKCQALSKLKERFGAR